MEKDQSVFKLSGLGEHSVGAIEPLEGGLCYMWNCQHLTRSFA